MKGEKAIIKSNKERKSQVLSEKRSQRELSVQLHPLHSTILNLQKTYGNRYVQMLIQTKLKVGKPGDIYEQEADRVADQVMQMSEPEVQRQSEEEKELIQANPIAGQIAPLIQRQVEEEEKEELIQPKLTNGDQVQHQEKEPEEEEETIQMKQAGVKEDSAIDERQILQSRGSGQPLDRGTREFMEPRFGYDFSQVRVHTDAQAAESVKMLNAKAYTIGKDIVFGSGQFAPETTFGRRLLAHELVHVVQCKGKDSRISFWGIGVHKKITKEAGLAMGLPDNFISHIQSRSAAMDRRPAAIIYNLNVLLRGKCSPEREAPNHGEGGLYRMTDRSAAASINTARQNQYLQKAIEYQNEFNEQQKKGGHVHKLGSLASKILARKIYRQLGHALHVAQDRGSHEEGLKGQGHDRKCFDCDNPSVNTTGYSIAIGNSKDVISQFKNARGY